MRKIDKTAMTTGHRYGGDEAATVGIADGGAAEDCVVPDTIDKAVELRTKAGLPSKPSSRGSTTPLSYPSQRRASRHLREDALMRSHNEAWDITTGVGSTAVMVAAFRAVEAARQDPLIRDPYARVLVAEAGSGSWETLLDDSMPAKLQSVSPESSALFHYMLGYHATRTHYFDSYLTSAGTAGTRQVVILAAGLDSRAYRMAWLVETTVYEIDQPKVLAYKSTTLAAHGVSPSAERREVPIDLRQDWPTALRAAGFDSAAPTAWLAEGLLMYLPADARARLFDQITELSAPGSRITADTVASHADVRRRAIWERFVRAAGEFGIRQTVNIDDVVYHGEEPTTAVGRLGDRGWHAALRPVQLEMRRLGRWIDVPGADDENLYGAFITGERT